MLRRFLLGIVTAMVVGGIFTVAPGAAVAKDPPLPVHYYYPYTYFPHNYWPTNSPQWPEQNGAPYMKPPAYMAYPPFREPNWRYEMWQPMKYYRGNHFWLDQF